MVNYIHNIITIQHLPLLAGSDYGTPDNYSPPVISPITISSDVSSVDIQITVINDSCREVNESFIGTLVVLPSQNVILGIPDQTMITILDDDREAL